LLRLGRAGGGRTHNKRFHKRGNGRRLAVKTHGGLERFAPRPRKVANHVVERKAGRRSLKGCHRQAGGARLMQIAWGAPVPFRFERFLRVT
jgi:hypothetical protein